MKILFTADNHLDFKQYGFAERRDDFQAAVGFVCSEAKRLQANVVIFGGDQFNNARPSDEAVRYLQEQVDILEMSGIKSLGIDGNHDLTGSGWLQVCGIAQLDAWRDGHPIPAQIGALKVVGINGGSPATIRAKLDDLEKCEAKFDILVLHTEVVEMCGFPSSTGLTASEIVYKLRNSGCKLVLMGHIHDYTEAVFGDVRFIYAGSTELWSRDEKPYKSYSMVEITNEGIKTAYLPIPVRPQLDVYLGSQADLDKLLADIDTATGSGRAPVVLARYDPELPDFKKKLESLLTGKAIFLAIPQSRAAAESGDPLARLSKDAFDRKGAMRSMADVLEKAFGSGSDEAGLILKMLENPNDIQDIVLRYAKEKGLSIR